MSKVDPKHKLQAGLCFDGDRMIAIAVILRELGDQLTKQLLNGERQPDLDQLLTSEQSQLMASSEIRRVPLRRAFRVPKDLRDNPKSSFVALIDQARSSDFEPWHQMMNDRLALDFSGTCGDILPDAFWPMVARAAWNEPGHRHEMAAVIYHYFKRGFILDPGEPLQCGFDPNTFWTLIGLSRGGHRDRFPLFDSHRRVRLRILDRLRQEARRQVVGAERWAGFWDQWLIRMAVERWPQTPDESDDGFLSTLRQLPLLRDLPIPLSVPHGPERKRAFLRFFFDTCYELGRVNRPSSQRDQALRFATVPNWHIQIPACLQKKYAALAVEEQDV